ncbi:hypothetical protein E0H39_29815 [Rhizobium leguminosarum bv. viciae]|uniref:hypothetical protein n=1 Tax=Rhizobium leguminosarum TaxID=384 RepID=UPI00103DE61A|nr:hypothetical protein [Rhizobium leguminosarum]TBY57705.1 hypothetical protein E0H39_29815 [Rhizobium leguminosarum bv. viciae]WSH00276.1 hypothetical protein U8P71_17120 [Rhizobium ruizarguesonis]
MSDRFQKGFNAHQHGLLRTLYGELVPRLEYIRVRPGWHRLVDEMFAQLGRLPDRRGLRVARVETRNAGVLAIETTGLAAGAEDMIASTKEAARTTCEHCGKPARLVVKVSAPFIELGDRLLCVDCAHMFHKEIAHDHG